MKKPLLVARGVYFKAYPSIETAVEGERLSAVGWIIGACVRDRVADFKS